MSFTPTAYSHTNFIQYRNNKKPTLNPESELSLSDEPVRARPKKKGMAKPGSLGGGVGSCIIDLALAMTLTLTFGSWLSSWIEYAN